MPQMGKSKLERLQDAGCFPEGASYDASDEDWIEQSLSDAEIDALIQIKSKLGADFFNREGSELKHYIFF